MGKLFIILFVIFIATVLLIPVLTMIFMACVYPFSTCSLYVDNKYIKDMPCINLRITKQPMENGTLVKVKESGKVIYLGKCQSITIIQHYRINKGIIDLKADAKITKRYRNGECDNE